MRVESARPDVGKMMLRVYGRSIHPELLDTRTRVDVHTNLWDATLQLCDTGHVVTFRYHQKVLCELAVSADSPLPHKQQVISRKIKGCRNESVEHDAGILYHVSFQVETVDPEVFLNVHEELMRDTARCRLAHQFPTASRLAPCPLSVIQTDEHPRSLLVHAFHTFPENLAIVRTQSLFEV